MRQQNHLIAYPVHVILDSFSARDQIGGIFTVWCVGSLARKNPAGCIHKFHGSCFSPQPSKCTRYFETKDKDSEYTACCMYSVTAPTRCMPNNNVSHNSRKNIILEGTNLEKVLVFPGKPQCFQSTAEPEPPRVLESTTALRRYRPIAEL